MRIRGLLSCGRPSISFEFFPPNDEEGRRQLWDAVVALHELRPTFVSVTQRNGEDEQRRTVELVAQIRRDLGLEVMGHLTCRNRPRPAVLAAFRQLADTGIDNVLVLRGDPPAEGDAFSPVPDGFAHADELAALARKNSSLCVGGACYPEGHPESAGPEEDLASARRKVEAGCEFLITQLFFDNQKYFDFVARARAAGIGVPIIPGIMPITNVRQIRRFTAMCGVGIPQLLLDELNRRRDDPNAVLALGIAHATAQCLELLQRGAPGIHFFTLNKSPAAQTILTAIRTVYPPACSDSSDPATRHTTRSGHAC